MTWTIAYFALMAITQAYVCFRWSSTGIIDATIKLIFFGGSVWSILKLAMELGFVVQVTA